MEENTYYIVVVWEDGKQEEVRLKASSYGAAERLLQKMAARKEMDYKIVEIHEH